MGETTGARIGGRKLLGVAVIFVLIYFGARAVLELTMLPVAVRVAAALLPVPAFVMMILGFYRAIGALDEFQRLIQLKALAFAFPASWVLILTLGLLEKAIKPPAEDLSDRHLWVLMPIFYYLGLWIARRRYR